MFTIDFPVNLGKPNLAVENSHPIVNLKMELQGILDIYQGKVTF
jgi:hypothetical protein